MNASILFVQGEMGVQGENGSPGVRGNEGMPGEMVLLYMLGVGMRTIKFAIYGPIRAIWAHLVAGVEMAWMDCQDHLALKEIRYSYADSTLVCG